jgi:hypothetical protein
MVPGGIDMNNWNCDCGNLVASGSNFCNKCGTSQATVIQRNQKIQTSGLTFSDFEEAVKSNNPPLEKTFDAQSSKSSLISRLVVRLSYFRPRKSRNYRHANARIRSGLGRRPLANGLIACVLILVFSTALYAALPNDFPRPVAKFLADIQHQTIKVIPISKAYKIGFETGWLLKDPYGYGDVIANLPQQNKILTSYGLDTIPEGSTVSRKSLRDSGLQLWPDVGPIAMIPNSASAKSSFADGCADGFFAHRL